MRARGRSRLIAAQLGLWLMLATSAQAAPAFVPPSGWSEGAAAAEPARRRAEAWAQAWGGELDQVMSTRSDDDFAETLALVEVAQPLPAQVLTDLDAGRSWLQARAVEALGPQAALEPETVELLPRPEPGVAVLIGRAQHEDRTAWIAVAPRGTRYLGLVLVVPNAEEILYANVFDDAVDGLDRLQAPVAPFERDRLRWGALGAWLVLGLAFGVQWIRRALPRPGARVAGRQASLVLASAAALVLVIAWLVLSGSSVELALAGTTPWGLALELAMGGVLAAGLVLGLGESWERKLEPVASAPRDGSFARGVRGPRSSASSSASMQMPMPKQVPMPAPDPPRPPAADTVKTTMPRPPEEQTVKTTAPRPPEEQTVKTTVPRPPDANTVKTTMPRPDVLDVERPKIEIDWS